MPDPSLSVLHVNTFLVSDLKADMVRYDGDAEAKAGSPNDLIGVAGGFDRPGSGHDLDLRNKSGAA